MEKANLDKRVPVPLYHELRTILQDRTREGHWKSGEQVPAEVRSVAKFGVSEATVRQALRDLSEAGLVLREQGRGTFVSNSEIQFGASQKRFATAVDTNATGVLKVSIGAPALGVERLTFLCGGQPLELTYSIIRGERCQAQLSLARAPER